MVKHVIRVKVAVFWGEHFVDGKLKGLTPLFL